MEYKGYTARVEFDDGANVFHGEVVGIRDVVTFEGTSVADLTEAFHDSVDDYLGLCAERGEDPERPYSGRFLVRLPSDLHRAAAMAAETRGMSLNAWVTDAIEEAAHISPVPS